MSDADNLARERDAAAKLLALIDQRFKDAERRILERRVELLRVMEEAAGIAGGGEVSELVGRTVADRSVR
jgi:hypothetical protein